jgi:hypothetical protein
MQQQPALNPACTYWLRGADSLKDEGWGLGLMGGGKVKARRCLQDTQAGAGRGEAVSQ